MKKNILFKQNDIVEFFIFTSIFNHYHKCLFSVKMQKNDQSQYANEFKL
jgi:hypothetical protein